MTDISQAKEKIYAHNNANPYVDITPYELKVGFPVVKYTGFFPQSGEVVIYVVPSATFKDQEQVVGYTGKSAGASVRVAKGLTVRTGGSGGHSIRDTVRKHSIGDLIITNKRVVFIGKDDNFDFSVNKISAIKPLSNETFIIQAGRSSKNIFINSNAVIYAAGFINYAISCYNQGLDVIAEKKQAEDEMTAEQRELCDSIRQEFASIPPVKTQKKKQKGVTGCLTHVLLGVLFFFVAILIGVIIYGISLSSPNHRLDSQGNRVEIQQYTDTELICKDGHPLIYDTFDKAKDFYADVDKDKVKVISGSDHASIERKLKSSTSDETLIYFIQDSIYNEFIGWVQINLFSSELTADMNIEKAVTLLTDYLPDDFGKYYKQDSCYKYTQGVVDVYTYSCRLNELGREYNSQFNDDANLSSYYYLRFIHFSDTNQWKLETGVSAYGGKGLEWIEKYAESWDIDINLYFEK